MNHQVREQASHLFAALAHPIRLQIVELLCTGEKTVNEIAAELKFSQSGTSQHLAVLTRAGLLTVKPHGVSRIYHIRGPRIERIMNLIAEFCEVHDLTGSREDVMEDANDGSLRSLVAGCAEKVIA